jgi:hypothetical protein
MEFEKLFYDIIEVDTDKYSVEISEVFKKDGEIVKENRTEVYQLIKYQDFEEDLIDYVVSNSEIKKLKYPTNFFERIYKKNELKEIDFSENIVISNSKNLSLISSEDEIYFTTDYIISTKKQNLLINKKDKLFYIDLSHFQVYQIN